MEAVASYRRARGVLAGGVSDEVSPGIELDRYRCEGPIEDAYAAQWFTVSPAEEAKFIGQGMWLVDGGDYDNDGRSEIVFAIDRYNEGGYELFYDDFKGHAEFRFSYH
jgi:hypothetical protein